MKRNRRVFLQVSAGALTTGLSTAFADRKADAASHPDFSEQGLEQSAPAVAANNGKKPLRLGLIIGIGKDPDAAMAKVHDLGLPTVQVFVDEFESGLVEPLRHALDRYGIEPTALVVGGPGKEVWDFYQGPLTIGLVPRETRDAALLKSRRLLISPSSAASLRSRHTADLFQKILTTRCIRRRWWQSVR